MSGHEGMPPLLAELLAARGPSGYEIAPAAAWAKAAKRLGMRVSSDTLGTPSAIVPSRDPGQMPGAAPSTAATLAGATTAGARSDARSEAAQSRRLMVMGHIDEIGLIVTHIDDEGFLWFREVGGWDAQILVGQRVRIVTANGDIPGAIGKKPIHLLRDEERKKVAEVRDLHIDIGASDGKQAMGLVRIGDVAVLDGDPIELPGGRLLSRALDNRLGSFVALEAARTIAEAGGIAGWETVAVAAAQEETTFGGSRTSSFALAPDAAIVVDVTHATDAPGIDVKEAGKHELGSGPVVTRGSTLHPALFELLCTAGRERDIAFTIDASGRHTGTDADAVHISRGGVPTALVSIPLRYMHSPVELVDLADVHACAALIAAAGLRLDAQTDFGRG